MAIGGGGNGGDPGLPTGYRGWVHGHGRMGGDSDNEGGEPGPPKNVLEYFPLIFPCTFSFVILSLSFVWRVIGCYLPRTAQTEGGLPHLGKYKEVINAKLYAPYQAMMTLEDREESGQQHIILIDSIIAIACARSDTGLGQRSTIAIIAICNRLLRGGSPADTKPFGGRRKRGRR